MNVHMYPMRQTRLRSVIIATCAGFLLSAGPVIAQDTSQYTSRDIGQELGSDKSDQAVTTAESSDRVVVTGEPPIEIRAEPVERAPLEGRRLNSPVPMTGIERETFIRRPSTRRLGDVINRLPGVFMGGPPGENKDIRLRGLDKEFTRFEFDGVQLPGAGEKREFQVNRLSPLLIGDLRVIRNPTAEYESDGIAGRVIAESRPIPEDWRLDLRGGFGGVDSFDGDQREVGFALGKMLTEQAGFNFAFDFTRESLAKIKTKRIFKDGSLNKTELEFESKPTDSYNVLADLLWRYDMGEFHVKPLLFHLEEDKDKRKLKTESGKDPELELEDEIKEQTTAGISVTHQHRFDYGRRLESELGYYNTRETKDKNKPKFKDKGSGFELDKTEIEDEEKEDEFWQMKSKIILPHDLLLPSELRAGFQLRFRDRFRRKDKIEVKPDGGTSDKGTAKDDYELDEKLLMGFLQNEFLLTDRFSILPGVRVEHTILDVRSGVGDEGDRSFTDINPSLHLLYRATDALTFKGAVSRGLNRPKFDELAPFVDDKGDRFVEGNPGLDPARSWNFDLGLEYAAPELFLGVNLFRKRIRDVIEEVDTGVDRGGKDVFRVENIGDGYIQGIELEQRADLSELVCPALQGLNLWANEAVFDSRLEDQLGRKRPFNEQPDLIANFGLDYAIEATRTNIALAAKFRDEIEKFKASSERESEDAIWTLDLGVRQKLGDRVTLVFEAVNLTDAEKEKTKFKSAEIEREFESTGRRFFVGFEATF